MTAPLLLLLLAQTASPQLGSALRKDGYVYRPPASFHVMRATPWAQSQVGAVGLTPGVEGKLSAALSDGEGPDAAVLLVAVVHEGFSASPAARDDFSAAALEHFRDLGIPLVLQGAARVDGPTPRIEVLGTLRRDGQVRSVLTVALAGEKLHGVLTFSAPSERWEALLPSLRASLATFRVEAAHAGPSRSLVGAVAGTLAGALLVSLIAWSRRPRSLSRR